MLEMEIMLNYSNSNVRDIIIVDNANYLLVLDHLLILRWTSYNAFKLKFSMECARNDQNYRI